MKALYVVAFCIFLCYCLSVLSGENQLYYITGIVVIYPHEKKKYTFKK